MAARFNPYRRAGAAAAPSEAFKWVLFPGARKRCWECGKEPLRVQDVAEHRRVYPKGSHEFLCTDCMKKRKQAAIEKTRRALGLR